MQKNLRKCKVYRPELSNISHEAIIGDNCRIHSHVWIGSGVKIGERCQIQSQAFIPPGVTIEDDVFVGPGAIFTNDPSPGTDRVYWKPTPTIVKRGAKIGAGAMIRAGVIIGEKAIIGMGSVVLEDVLEAEVWVGNPARKLR